MPENDVKAHYYLSLVMIVFGVPRLYYLYKVTRFVCCGGLKRDTADDRLALINGINILTPVLLLQILGTVVIIIISGAGLISTCPYLLNVIFTYLVTKWWGSSLFDYEIERRKTETWKQEH